MSFIYPKNIQFECNKCAICCGNTKEKTRHILMLKNEAQEIQEQTKLYTHDFCYEIPNKQPYLYEMKIANNKCYFLKPDGYCNIYNYRPLICRFYPFELKFNEEQQTYIFTATKECPTLNQNGKHLTQTDFKQLFWLAEKKLL
ncbi:MAG: YkgJ family cysteine cluster protein [Nitrososphaerota archaeon]|nr:YkgJ family cysteine cluster protein [Candidatus Termiticorpusculum sp.]MDR0461149.1 YkgJ family cysteine cluster protein [Nitrososphaerota archaeon]